MYIRKVLVNMFLMARADDLLNLVCEGKLNVPARDGGRGHRYQILRYHKVSNESHPFFPALKPNVFENQILFLKEHYSIYPLDELVRASRKGYVPPRAVALTFDDGYADNFTVAFPLLKKHHVPATIFLTTGAIGGKQVLWHDRVFDAFRYATVRSAYLDQGTILIADLQDHGAARASLQATLEYARSISNEKRLEFIEQIEAALQPDLTGNSRTSILSWDQVRQMHSEGIDFGSHTVSHPILSKISPDDLVRELEDSKHNIEEQLGKTIFGFAYPNGRIQDYNRFVKDALKNLGYGYALTTTAGFNSVGTDLFALKRGQPWQEDPKLFRISFFLQRRGWGR